MNSVDLASWTHLFTQSLPHKRYNSGITDYTGYTYQYHKDGVIQTSTSFPANIQHDLFIMMAVN